MSIPVPATPGAPAHPSWCHPDRCTVGVERAGLGDHRSAELVVPGEHGVDPTITVWAQQFGYDEPAVAEVFVMARWTLVELPSGDVESMVTHALRLPEAFALAAAVNELATMGGAR